MRKMEMKIKAFGLEWFRPNGKRVRVSQRVGDSMRNQARGGGRVGPQPERICLP